MTKDVLVTLGETADQIVPEVAHVGCRPGVSELQEYVGCGEEREQSQTMKFKCGWQRVVVLPVYKRHDVFVKRSPAS